MSGVSGDDQQLGRFDYLAQLNRRTKSLRMKVLRAT
jgi:hypothetical protein